MHDLLRRHGSATAAKALFGSGVLTIAVLGAAAVGACGDDTATGSTGDTTATTSTGGGGAGGGGGATIGSGGAGGTGTGGAGGCADALPPITVAPALLSETGLYSDIASDTVATHAREFQPKYPLWTDGAAKRRWAYLPECGGPIDTTTSMDIWQMPVGARFWKEFTRDGVRVETRMIVRTGIAPDAFLYATYVWNGANDDADYEPDGVTDALGTPHDVPPVVLCTFCHTAGWRILGFSAVQLSHSLPGETIASLSTEGKLSTPLPAGFTAPGSTVAQDALGYLHANCGNCHHPGGSVPQVSMHLDLRTTDTTVAGTHAMTTAVNTPTTGYACGPTMLAGGCDRLEPSSTDLSAIYLRMGSRPGPPTPPAPFLTTGQMPPLGTELADSSGLAAVAAWINEPPQ